MSTTKIDKLIITGLTEETAVRPILVWNPVTKRVNWQQSPNARIAALEAKTDADNNFKVITGYNFNAGNRVMTMTAGWVGTINGVDYTNVADQVLTPAIPLASTGYSRIDLIVFNTSGNFVRIQGIQSQLTPVAPAKPINTLEATFLTITATAVNVPVVPKPKAPVTSVNGMLGDVVIQKATDTVRGTIKIDTPTADPVVYTKETNDNLLNGKANFFLDIKNITGITYNVILTDILFQLVYAGTLPMNVIIPNNTAVPFPIGTMFYTLGTNTGILTASGAAGVTLNVKAGISLSAIQNEVRQYTKIGVNTWSVRGDLNLGAVTQTELSYLQGLTSNIQAQINAKTALSGGVANRIMMWLNATQATVSRIWDTGTFLGIGTVNTPTKDLTLGNQYDREIAVEKSNNTTNGKNLKVSAGSSINYVENVNFLSINETPRAWYKTCSTITNNTYAAIGGGGTGSIYMQTNGTGGFANVGFNGAWESMCAHQNGNVYAATGNNLYMQTNGTGSFNFIQAIGFYAMCVKSNGDVYGLNGSTIYIQTNGTGSFIASSITMPNNATDIATHPNGDIYMTYYGGIAKQTGGIGNFIVTGATSRNYIAIACSTTDNNIYVTTTTGEIYVQLNASGSFINTNAYSAFWTGLSVNVYGNVYAVAKFDSNFNLISIYMQQNNGVGTPNLDGGTLKQAAGTGKGTGKSRWEVYTGQKLASGTDMQVETLREYIDENGHHVYTSMPVYADNAAALAASLPVGCKYRTATGDLKIVY